VDDWASVNVMGELGEKTLDQIEPGAVLGRKGELKAALGLGGELCFRLLGDVCGMVVEDQLDGGIRRIGSIEQLEKFDELTGFTPDNLLVDAADGDAWLPGEWPCRLR